jgi:hypothetical protein
MADNALSIWNPTDQVIIPPTAATPADIIEYGQATLSRRDIQAVISGFQAGGFEMVSTFIWAKAGAALKKQVASLGMEFVGEMLRRPDLDDDSDPSTALSDYEAIALAEDLGMVTATQGLRLKHAMQLVSHFANLDQPQADEEQMQQEEAISILRTCITSILGKPRFDAAVQFMDFRRALGDRTLKEDDGDVSAVLASPYFFVRTTLSALLAMIKGAQSAVLEHAVGNTTLLVPLFWERLRDNERWQIGQAYAEVMASGNRLASAGLKNALLKVHGFDYVPETLRSNTFTEVAARVLSAHFAFNNFYNEEEPMSTLANLGTAIPMPAFAKCMEATLAVWLGNFYGQSRSAVPHATRVLQALRPTQWEYYFNECLISDRTVLDKLCSEPNPIGRWRQLMTMISSTRLNVRDKVVSDLVNRINDLTEANVMAKARSLRTRGGSETGR